MARIRSIHQGYFTDERIVSVSAFARLLLIGIWTEADDQGIFEWKPVTLKMKLFPVDNVDIASLLAELAGADALQKFSKASREFGVIRNFRKFQRPKSPNAMHPRPDDWGNYVGLSRANGESGNDKPVGVAPLDDDKSASVPLNGEKSFQMEDGGGRVGDKKGTEAPKAPNGRSRIPDPDAELFRCGKAVLGPSAGGQIAKLKAMFGGDVAKTREFVEAAAAKENPVQYVAATIAKHSGKTASLQKGAYDSAL